MNLTNFVLAFAILGQSLQGAFSYISEHDIYLSVSDESRSSALGYYDGECSDSPCHEDATCIVMGPGLFDCQCNGDLVGDGITACDVATGPKAVPTSMELERGLKRKRKPKRTTPAPTEPPSPVCFPGDAVVIVKNVGEVKMNNLKIGDHVLAMGGKFVPVYGFINQVFDVTRHFLRLHTNGTSMPLEISEDHFIFLYDQQDIPVVSSSLTKGDVLVGANSMEPLKILKIEAVTNKGYFSPLTVDGTIAVNGIMASNHASAYPGVSNEYWYLLNKKIMTRKTFDHMRYSPLRLASLGISPWFGKLYSPTGLHYLTFSYFKASIWMSDSSMSYVLQALGVIIWHSLIGFALICYAIEHLVGPAMGPAIILISIAAAVAVTRGQKKKAGGLKIKCD